MNFKEQVYNNDSVSSALTALRIMEENVYDPEVPGEPALDVITLHKNFHFLNSLNLNS